MDSTRLHVDWVSTACRLHTEVESFPYGSLPPEGGLAALVPAHHPWFFCVWISALRPVLPWDAHRAGIFVCEANTMLFLWLVIFGGFDSKAGQSVDKTLNKRLIQ